MIFLGIYSLITRFMGPTWDPPGANRTQVGPMLAPWILLSGSCHEILTYRTPCCKILQFHVSNMQSGCICINHKKCMAHLSFPLWSVGWEKKQVELWLIHPTKTDVYTFSCYLYASMNKQKVHPFDICFSFRIWPIYLDNCSCWLNYAANLGCSS